MNIKQEDFPLYQLLVELNQPGIERAKADFAAACKGGDEAQYCFAMGIQTVAVNVPAEAIPGCTDDMMKTTLRSCLTIFNELAAKSHDGAVFMVKNFKQRGLGL